MIYILRRSVEARVLFCQVEWGTLIGVKGHSFSEYEWGTLLKSLDTRRNALSRASSRSRCVSVCDRSRACLVLNLCCAFSRLLRVFFFRDFVVSRERLDTISRARTLRA